MPVTKVKERPILFSGPMVRAILDGRKTQTRRVLKQQPPAGYEPHTAVDFAEGYFCNGHALWKPNCPYGSPGDRLWVRETWCRDANGWFIYRADNGREDSKPTFRKWRPSIHLPKWASRITLEVNEVRVEKLNDIDRGDCMAEGCPFANMNDGPDPRRWYQELWESINGAGSWAENPWVWVIEFKKV